MIHNMTKVLTEKVVSTVFDENNSISALQKAYTTSTHGTYNAVIVLAQNCTNSHNKSDVS